MNRERVPAVPQSAQNAAFLAVATAIALAMRLFLFPLESGDYQQFLHPWFETLRQNGGLAAIGLEIGDYTPPYFYVLALLTCLPVRDLFSIKPFPVRRMWCSPCLRQTWPPAITVSRRPGRQPTVRCCSCPRCFSIRQPGASAMPCMCRRCLPSSITRGRGGMWPPPSRSACQSRSSCRPFSSRRFFSCFC